MFTKPELLYIILHCIACALQTQHEKAERLASQQDALARKQASATKFIEKQKRLSNTKRMDENKQAQAKQRAAKMDRLSLFHEDGHHFKTHSVKSFQEAWRKGKIDTLPSVVQMNTRSNPLIQFKFKPPEDTDTGALGTLIKFSDAAFAYGSPTSAAIQQGQSSGAPPILRSMTLQVGRGWKPGVNIYF